MSRGMIPPQAVDEEKAILGYCLNYKEGYEKASEIIKPIHFYQEKNRLIWIAIGKVFEKRMTPDLLSVQHELSVAGSLESVGGIFYLTELRPCPPRNLDANCKRVREMFMHRGRIIIAQRMMESAYASTDDPFEALDADRRSLLELEPEVSTMVEMSSYVVPVIDSVEKAMRGETTALNIGFNDIDREYAYEAGELVVIGADSGTGKTAFALQIAKRLHKLNPTIPVIFNSLEMRGQQLAARDMASTIGVSQMRFRTGHGITASHIGDMVHLESKYSGIFVVRCKTNDELATRVRQLRKQLGLTEADRVIVVSDYAQIMTGVKGGNREQEVASVSRLAKELAEDQNVLYFLLSQMNKAAGKDRPTQKNLRESSGLGNDADWVMLLYSPNRNGITEYEDGSSTQNIIETIFDKVRFGKPGNIIKLHMSDSGLIGDLKQEEPDGDFPDHRRISPKIIDFGQSRHSEEQPTGGDFFPF
jgi:replicative DNA helicase